MLSCPPALCFAFAPFGFVFWLCQLAFGFLAFWLSAKCEHAPQHVGESFLPPFVSVSFDIFFVGRGSSICAALINCVRMFAQFVNIIAQNMTIGSRPRTAHCPIPPAITSCSATKNGLPK